VELFQLFVVLGNIKQPAPLSVTTARVVLLRRGGARPQDAAPSPGAAFAISRKLLWCRGKKCGVVLPPVTLYGPLVSCVRIGAGWIPVRARERITKSITCGSTHRRHRRRQHKHRVRCGENKGQSRRLGTLGVQETGKKKKPQFSFQPDGGVHVSVDALGLPLVRIHSEVAL